MADGAADVSRETVVDGSVLTLVDKLLYLHRHKLFGFQPAPANVGPFGGAWRFFGEA